VGFTERMVMSTSEAFAALVLAASPGQTGGPNAQDIRTALTHMQAAVDYSQQIAQRAESQGLIR
jgi:hypothetical protein